MGMAKSNTWTALQQGMIQEKIFTEIKCYSLDENKTSKQNYPGVQQTCIPLYNPTSSQLMTNSLKLKFIVSLK